VVAVVTTAVAAIVAAVVVVVVTVEADTVTVEGNEFTLDETARDFGDDLPAGTNDLLSDEVTLLDGETALLPDVLDTLLTDEDRDVVALLGDDAVTLLTGDEVTLLFAAVTLAGDDTLVANTAHGLLTRLEILLSDTEDLFVGDAALFACDAILFAAGGTLQEEVTLPADDETFCVGDAFAVESTVASDDPSTLQSTIVGVFIASGITLGSVAATFPEFALALLDTVRLLGGGAVIVTPDNLLLPVATPSATLSLLLFTDAHGFLPIALVTAAAVSNRCLFFGVAITE
jgi:hypothetical protein